MISTEQKYELIKNATQVKDNAYAPYSNYNVGAALLAKSGKIYIGSNFENAAFGAGVCAERVALGSAISAGEREFVALCICGNDANITPCGICRQSLNEFDDIDVICCDGKGNVLEYRLSEIFPKAFKLK